MFDVISVVPEVDRPETKHKIKLVHSPKEKTVICKGPVTAIAAINGYYISAVGSKVCHVFRIVP